MPAEQIVALLIAERDRLNRAIEALGGAVGKRRGRPPKSASTPSAPPAPKKRGRMFTAAQRKAQADRMKKLWAERRKAKKSAV